LFLQSVVEGFGEAKKKKIKHEYIKNAAVSLD
jgi:hypothetical protein